MGNRQIRMGNLMKKAYSTHADDCGSIILFAETPGLARSLAQCTGYYDECDFIEIKVKREPLADSQFKNSESGILEWGGNEKFYRSIEWFENEDYSSECRECGLFEFEKIPESKLIFDKEDEPICKGCSN